MKKILNWFLRPISPAVTLFALGIFTSLGAIAAFVNFVLFWYTYYPLYVRYSYLAISFLFLCMFSWCCNKAVELEKEIAQKIKD